MVALKQAELDVQTKLAQLGFQDAEELASLADQDTANARARQIALRDRMPAFLASGVTLGFFGTLYLLSRGVNPQAHDVMLTMVGALGTAWISVVGYYFGSSAGSARKLRYSPMVMAMLKIDPFPQG